MFYVNKHTCTHDQALEIHCSFQYDPRAPTCRISDLTLKWQELKQITQSHTFNEVDHGAMLIGKH